LVPQQMAPALAKTTIGVMGSGTDEHDDLARIVGEMLADVGVNLLTGGGRGVMTSVSRAFTRHPNRRGICIGIIPCASESDRGSPKDGYPNAFVELPIYTHLPYAGAQGAHDLSRNHINVLSAAAIIALPGEEGTASEVELALRYGKPVIAFSPNLKLVERFSQQVRRVQRIEAVRKFLRPYVKAG
jgi:uncharacterized protein (TIGR00725 family)